MISIVVIMSTVISAVGDTLDLPMESQSNFVTKPANKSHDQSPTQYYAPHSPRIRGPFFLGYVCALLHI